MTAIVKDTFTDIDGTNLANHIADTGQSWTIYESPLTITSNQLSSQTTNESLGWIETGISDFDFSVNIETHGIEEDIYFRYQDYNNWIRISTYGTTNIYLQKKVNGSKSTVKSGTTSFPANSVLDINANGSTINVTMNGTVIFSNVSITDLTTATKVGLGTWNSPNTRYDNLEVDSLTTSGTTYIGSGLSQGQSSLTSNETLILSPTTYSENVDTTGFSSLATTDKLVENVSGLSNGQSSLTTSETIISHTGTSYSASGGTNASSSLNTNDHVIYNDSGQSQSVSNITTHETKSYSANGNVNSTSTLSHVGNVIYVDFGSSNGQSNLTTTETFVQHGTTTYSGNGHSDGLSSVSSNDKVTYESSSSVNGQSTLTTDEHESLSAQGSVNGISSATSTEQFIGHATNSYSGMGLSDGTSNVTSSEKKSYAATGHVNGVSNTISHDNVVYFPIGTANGSVNINTTERFVSVFEVIGIIELNGVLQVELEFVGTYDLNIYQKGVV